MDEFKQQLTALLDHFLAEGGDPIFLIVDLEGVGEIKDAHGEESLRKFKQAAIDAVVAATRGADAFTYGEDRVVAILDGRDYDRLRTFALIQKLRKAIPLLGQSFDCYLRPDFDLVDYQPEHGAAGLINQIASARNLRKQSERQSA